MSDDDSTPIPFRPKPIAEGNPDSRAQLPRPQSWRNFAGERLIEKGRNRRSRFDNIPTNQLDEQRRYDIESGKPWRLDIPDETNRYLGDSGNESDGYGLAFAVWKFGVERNFLRDNPDYLYTELDQCSDGKADIDKQVLRLEYEQKSRDFQLALFEGLLRLCQKKQIEIHGRTIPDGESVLVSLDDLERIDFADLDQCTLTGPGVRFIDCFVSEITPIDGWHRATLYNIVAEICRQLEPTLTFGHGEQSRLVSAIINDPRVMSREKVMNKQTVERYVGEWYRPVKAKYQEQKKNPSKPEKLPKIR